MGNEVLNTPTSPPVGPVVPVGLATKLGLYGTVILGLVAALVPLLPSADATESKFFAALSAGVAGLTIIGRMLQSAAAFMGSAGAGFAGTVDPLDADDVDDEVIDGPSAAPTEEELKAAYAEDAPVDAPPTVGGKAGEVPPVHD